MAFNQPSTNDQQRQFDAFKEWMLDFFCENEGVGTTNHSDSNATSTAQANVRTKAEEPLLPVHSFMSGDTALPSEDPNPDDIEKLLAKDMEAMKFEERELMYESIHGVDPIVKETPELILEKLAEMDKEVKKQMATQPGLSKNHAYNKAKEIEPGYVQGLRLMFLRVDRFVASKAAKRMLGFFEAKLELFGPDALARPLYLSDFDKHDMAYMRGGHFQLLPFRDRSGRAICCDFGDPNHTIYHSFNNLLKTWFYIMCAAAESEETQIRGIVFISFMSVPLSSQTPSREKFYRIPRTMGVLPIRNVSVHACYQDPLYRILFAMAVVSLPPPRSRLRLHQGSPTETKYSLMTYGIPVSAIPVTDSGKVKNENHKRWLLRRAAKDDHLKMASASSRYTNNVISTTLPRYAFSGSKFDFEGIDFPGPNDVLLGRGKPFRAHMGNVRFRNIVEQFRDEYDSKEVLGQKAKLAETIIALVKDSVPVGRFLKIHPEHGWWVHASQNEIIEKIRQAFRTARSSTTAVKSASSSRATPGNARDEKYDTVSKGTNSKRVKVIPTLK